MVHKQILVVGLCRPLFRALLVCSASLLIAEEKASLPHAYSIPTIDISDQKSCQIEHSFCDSTRPPKKLVCDMSRQPV